MSDEQDRIRTLIDEHNDWPSPFLFKFIVPAGQLGELRDRLKDFELHQRSSRNGNYTSVSLRPLMESSDAVLAIYERVVDLDGIIRL